MSFYSLTWRQIELHELQELTSYIGHMHKDTLVKINLLPHVLLLKNKKTVAPKMVSTVGSFRNCKYPTHRKTAGTFFRHVCENCDRTHMSKNCAQKNISKRLDKTSRAVYSTRCVYNTNIVEKKLFNQLYVRNLLSIYRNKSPSTLYSDIVKIHSKHRVNSVLGLNPSEADKIQSKPVKDCYKSNVDVQNKVSINDVRSSSVSSKNNIETSE